MRFRRYALLLAVLLTSLFLLTVQTRGGGPTRAADLVALAITPVQSLLANAHRGALTAWHTFTDWKTVRSENIALRADNERLRVQSLQVRETDQENRRLRRLLALRERMPLATLTGEIIGREGVPCAEGAAVGLGEQALDRGDRQRDEVGGPRRSPAPRLDRQQEQGHQQHC